MNSYKPPTKITRPILVGLPYAVGVRLLQSDGTPHTTTQFTVQSWIRDAVGSPTEFSVSVVGGVFVLSLTQAETTALKNGNYSSDILIRQGDEVFRRAVLRYQVETPKTTWEVDPDLFSTPDPVLEFRDTIPDVLELPGGNDVGAAISQAISAHEGATNPHPQYSSQTVSFPTPLTQWIVNHNLGRYPPVQVLNVALQAVSADVDHVSVNQFRVSFVAPVAGYAVYS